MKQIIIEKKKGKHGYYCIIKCNICGKLKKFNYYNIKKGGGLFCSNNCRNKAQIGKIGNRKGKKHRKESIEKIKQARSKQKSPFKGKKHTKKSKKLISTNHADFKLEKHPNWRNGISFEPYKPEFNETLKEKIRNRDNYTCQNLDCENKQTKTKFPIHHIDYNKNNNNETNLITLCFSCHSKSNYKRKEWCNKLTKICQLKYAYPRTTAQT